MNIKLTKLSMDRLMTISRERNVYPEDIINLLFEKLTSVEIKEIIDDECRREKQQV